MTIQFANKIDLIITSRVAICLETEYIDRRRRVQTTPCFGLGYIYGHINSFGLGFVNHHRAKRREPYANENRMSVDVITASNCKHTAQQMAATSIFLAGYISLVPQIR